jgi:ABC-2 type transport system permease protein
MNVQARILYPLTALVTTNTKMSLCSRKAFFPGLIVSFPLGLVILFRILWIIWGAPSDDPEATDAFLIYSMLCAMMYMQLIIPLLSLLKGMGTFTEEIEEGTLMFLRLRPAPRSIIIAGKFLSYVITTSVLLTISLWGVYTILSTIPGAGMFLGDLNVLIKDTWVLILGLVAYGAVMMLIGTYFKHRIMIGVFVLFIWDAWAAYIPGSAHKFTIKFYMQSIFPHQREQTIVESLLTNNPPAAMTTSIITLLGIALVSIFLTSLAFQFKELSSGQENES